MFSDEHGRETPVISNQSGSFYLGKDRANKNNILKELQKPLADRILLVGQALRLGKSVSLIHNASKIDPWFIAQIEEVIKTENFIKRKGLPKDPLTIQRIKAMGFSDRKIAQLINKKEEEVFKLRNKYKIYPDFKRIDTCAAEFKSLTPYMYSTYSKSTLNNKVDLIELVKE